MGARANYAIRENSLVELYYSHWGAETVHEDVFWGPVRTEAFIRKNDPTDEWLDDVWGEGAIALDKDHRRLTFYCYECPDEEDVRRVHEALLAETWGAAGWSVERAQHWSDVAAAMGVDRELVTSKSSPPTQIDFDKLGRNLEASSCCALLSVKTEADWDDRAIDFIVLGFLMNGPTLLDQLSTIADLTKLRKAFDARRKDDSAKTLGDWIDEFCAIDVRSRTIRLSVPEHEMQHVPFVQELWAGWSVVHGSGGALEHFRYTGRELPPDFIRSPKPPPSPPPNRTHDECLRIIRERLASNESRKTQDVASHHRFIEFLNEKDGPVTPAPGFLKRVPSSQPSVLDRLKFRLRKLAWRR